MNNMKSEVEAMEMRIWKRIEKKIGPTAYLTKRCYKEWTQNDS